MGRRTPQRGPEPGNGQDPHLPDPVSQADQFALDAPTTPAWALLRQLSHQRAYLGWDRRSSRPSRRVSVGSFLLDQVPLVFPSSAVIEGVGWPG